MSDTDEIATDIVLSFGLPYSLCRWIDPLVDCYGCPHFDQDFGVRLTCPIEQEIKRRDN